MQNTRLNVLISAHELSPFQGSERAVGWNVVNRLGKYHNITVLYASGSHYIPNSYENAITNYLSNNSNPYNIQFIPVRQSRTYKFIASLNKLLSNKSSSLGNPLLYYTAYNIWQKKAYKIAKDLCENSTFDIAHHLTSITYKEPGYLWKLPIPFIWGPTGGMRSIPIKFYEFIGFKAACVEAFRYVSNQFLFRSNYRINKALKKSSLIYNFSKEDQILFSNTIGKETKLMLETASVARERNVTMSSGNPTQTSVIWCGSILKRKALEIILYAISSDNQLQKNIKLKVVGSGPLENDYKRLSEKLKIANCIEWIGKVDHSNVFRIMQESDFLVHSSLSEGTPHVILEALSLGLPVVCHDISGMSLVVNDKCGMKIPLVSPKKSIEGFKLAMLELINNSQKLTEMKAGAVERASELSWDAMVDTIANDYNTVHSESLKNNK